MNSSEFSATDAECAALQNLAPCKDTDQPSVTFESITFSDGTTIEIGPTDVVVLVGPNNAGKSLALRELEAQVGGELETIMVVSSVKPRQVGTGESFEALVRANAKVTTNALGNGLDIRGYGIQLGMGGWDLQRMWPRDIGVFRPLFCRRIPTESRITDSNPADAIDTLSETASHPIHLLYDDRVELRMSEHFRQAFGDDLILYRAGGSKCHLLVGNRLIPDEGEDRISASYCERLLASTVRLEDQGDGMRSFASVILNLLAPITPSILLLDEPEAFLHPPQARVLGEIIATEKSNRAQLFVATHSPDVLHGLIDVAPEHLRVLRIQRDGNVNRVKELDKDLVSKISADPLMKYSGVMSGVFHQRVVICEADSDCMFYSSILDVPEVHGSRTPDVLFVHGNGKHRMAALAETLVALDVPVDVVADIDVLRENAVLERLVHALGGDWARIQPLAHSVRNAIEQHRARLTAGDIKDKVDTIFESVPRTEEFPRAKRSEIEAIFREVSLWDTVKRAGDAAIPRGQPTQQFQGLQALCKEIGLWIVPVGELEGFCKSVSGKGPAWVQQVIEQRNLEDDPELEGARKFMHDMWRGNR